MEKALFNNLTQETQPISELIELTKERVLYNGRRAKMMFNSNCCYSHAHIMFCVGYAIRNPDSINRGCD